MHLHSNIVSLFPPGPAPFAPPATAIRPAHQGHDPDMIEIARRLGIACESWRTIIEKVRALNSRYGFPDPKNPRFIKGEMICGDRAIVRRSRFPRARVEDWFDNHRSPAQCAADEGDEVAVASAALSANARGLVASLKTNHG